MNSTRDLSSIQPSPNSGSISPNTGLSIESLVEGTEKGRWTEDSKVEMNVIGAADDRGDVSHGHNDDSDSSIRNNAGMTSAVYSPLPHDQG